MKSSLGTHPFGPWIRRKLTDRNLRPVDLCNGICMDIGIVRAWIEGRQAPVHHWRNVITFLSRYQPIDGHEINAVCEMLGVSRGMFRLPKGMERP